MSFKGDVFNSLDEITEDLSAESRASINICFAFSFGILEDQLQKQEKKEK